MNPQAEKSTHIDPLEEDRRISYPIPEEVGECWGEMVKTHYAISLFKGTHRFKEEARGQIYPNIK
ncbi:MAG: hypothetical protein HQK61_11920, partial [Desulfamplus sp.]|nr:hypothetical protein [Desulfamplus sp.]